MQNSLEVSPTAQGLLFRQAKRAWERQHRWSKDKVHIFGSCGTVATERRWASTWDWREEPRTRWPLLEWTLSEKTTNLNSKRPCMHPSLNNLIFKCLCKLHIQASILFCVFHKHKLVKYFKQENLPAFYRYQALYGSLTVLCQR